MGRYATREDEIDRMLRAGLFVDLPESVAFFPAEGRFFEGVDQPVVTIGATGTKVIIHAEATDTFERAQSSFGTFDVVITNPPKLVLAKSEGPWSSWWEAVPVEKVGDEFKLRWRDGVNKLLCTRPRLGLALICPDAT